MPKSRLVRDMENSYLTVEARDSSAMNDLIGHSITYRIAVGPHEGKKAFTLQTIAAHTQERDDGGLAKSAGFSLHCGVAAGRHQRYLSWSGCAVPLRRGSAPDLLPRRELSRRDPVSREVPFMQPEQLVLGDLPELLAFAGLDILTRP